MLLSVETTKLQDWQSFPLRQQAFWHTIYIMINYKSLPWICMQKVIENSSKIYLVIWLYLHNSFLSPILPITHCIPSITRVLILQGKIHIFFNNLYIKRCEWNATCPETWALWTNFTIVNQVDNLFVDMLKRFIIIRVLWRFRTILIIILIFP